MCNLGSMPWWVLVWVCCRDFWVPGQAVLGAAMVGDHFWWLSSQGASFIPIFLPFWYFCSCTCAQWLWRSNTSILSTVELLPFFIRLGFHGRSSKKSDPVASYHLSYHACQSIPDNLINKWLFCVRKCSGLKLCVPAKFIGWNPSPQRWWY